MSIQSHLVNPPSVPGYTAHNDSHAKRCTTLSGSLSTVQNGYARLEELKKTQREIDSARFPLVSKDFKQIEMLNKLIGQSNREVGEFYTGWSTQQRNSRVDILLRNCKAGANDGLRLKGNLIKTTAYAGYNPLKLCFGLGAAERIKQSQELSVLLDKAGGKITRTNLDPGAVLHGISNQHAEQLLAQSLPRLPHELREQVKQAPNSIAKFERLENLVHAEVAKLTAERQEVVNESTLKLNLDRLPDCLKGDVDKCVEGTKNAADKLARLEGNWPTFRFAAITNEMGRSAEESLPLILNGMPAGLSSDLQSKLENVTVSKRYPRAYMQLVQLGTMYPSQDVKVALVAASYERAVDRVNFPQFTKAPNVW